MKKRPLFSKATALTLVCVMLVAAFAACNIGDFPIEGTPGQTTPPTEHVYDPNAKTYTITYIDAPNHSNPTTYTSNDYIILQRPVWNGLSFSHWSDKDGNVITEIPYDTTGNLVLRANWVYNENFVVSNNTDQVFLTYYNDELNAFQFVYDLGTINNVVLDTLDSYKYNGATNHTWSFSKTVSFTESKAQNIANTVSKSVTSSSSWSSAVADVINNSTSNSRDESASASFEVGNTWAKVGAEASWANGHVNTEGSSNTTTKSNSGSTGSSSGESSTVSSTLTFVSDTTTQVTRSETMEPAISPAGMYKYVQAGTVQVFAIVTYDPAVKDYYINIYSYISNTFETMLYEPVPEYNSDISIVSSEPFTFDIDINALVSRIDNAYTIQFDANGGIGTMPVQLMLPDTYTALLSNRFTKTGYKFVGWRVKDGDKTVVYLDGNEVQNLGSPKETVTLEAVWASTEPQYSQWSEWSDWTFERQDTNALVKEESRTVWSYYYFQCPSCGRHTPQYGRSCNYWKGGCGSTKILESSWHPVYSTISYDEIALHYGWAGSNWYYAEIDGQIVFRWTASTGGVKTQYRYSTRTLIEE